MKTKSIRYIVSQCICCFLLILLINLSIDLPGRINFNNGFFTLKNTQIVDETESIYEFVSEEIFNNEVPESDDNDTEKCLVSFELYCPGSMPGENIIPTFPGHLFQYCKDGFLAHFPEPNSPPPKLV